MPLEKKLINVPLSAGLGQKADIRGLEPVQAAKMQNCVRLKNGAIRKRAGMSALSNTRANASATTIGLCVAGGAHRNSMWMTDESVLYTYSDEGAAWTAQADIAAPIALDMVRAVAMTANLVDVDWCLANGLIYMVVLADPSSSGTTQVYLSILDASAYGSASGIGGVQQGISGAVVLPLTGITSGNACIAPKVVACGTNVVVTYVQASVGIVAQRFDATNPTNSGTGNPSVATSTLVASASLSAGAVAGGYDIAPVVGDATRFLLAYTSNTPAAVLVTVTVSSLALGTPRAPLGATSVNATSVACYGTNGGYLWAVYGAIVTSKRTLYAGFYNEGGATLSTTSTSFYQDSTTAIPMGKIGLCPANTDASGDVVGPIWSSGYASGTTAMQSAQVQYCTLTGSGTTATATGVGNFVPNVQLASRPIFDGFNGVGWAALSTPSTLQGTTYLCRLSAWGKNVIATVPAHPSVCLQPRLQKSVAQPITAGGSFTLPHLLPLTTIASLSQRSGLTNAVGVQAFPVLYSTSTFHNAVALQPIDFFPTMGRASDALGTMTAICCGMPTIFDGEFAVEAGFCSYPEPSVTAVGSGGSLSAGTYQYIVTYEWYDATGNVHRSATSPTVTVTTVNSDSTHVVIPTPLSRRYPGLSGLSNMTTLFAVVYRTTVGGSTFYRQTADPPPSANAIVNLGANTITITDTMSDATLTAAATAQLLYTTGGNLDNFNPPSARCVVQHTSRWFLAGCDNPAAIWASKALTDGECPGFNEQLAILAHGAVRALAPLEDKLVVFYQQGARYGIEYVTGQGPLDTGSQSDWSPPLPIPSDVGAIDQRGTCVGPFGVLFRSPVGGPNGTGGIFLLSRDLQVTYVSGPVEDALAASPIVTSMVVHPNNGRVYITLITNDASPATTNGATRLVWDYVNGGAWSSDSVWDTDASATGLAVRSGWVAMAGGISKTQGPTYHCASATGRVYRENDLGSGAGAFMDSGSQWVTMSYTTAPLKPDLDGFARFWRVQLQADSLEAHDLTMQLLYDYAPASYYQESHTWAATSIATFDRFPQVDVEMLCGNQKAKAIQIVLSDATPTGGGATTGQGPSWSIVSVELGVKSGRYPNIPPGQRS